MKPTFKKTELPNAAINLMSMFVLPSCKIDQKLIFSHSRLPRRSSLSYFMFPFIENIGFVVSRRPPLSQSVRSRECTWRPHFFSSRSVAKIHADFSRGPLHRARARARAFATPTGGKKKHAALSRPATLSPPPSRRALFSFCRRCPTWRYVKRIYNWRYDGRALESNTSILIPATPTPRIQTIPPTRPCHFRGNPSNVKAHPGRSAFTVWILNLYRTVERTSEKYAGRDEQKRIFLGDRVALSLPIVFRTDNFIFCDMCVYMWFFMR